MLQINRKSALGGCGLVALLVCLWSPWIPSYDGVRLTTWIEELDHAYDTSIFAFPDNIPTQAVCAVRELSSSALPRFMRMLKRQDSTFHKHANELLEKQLMIEWRFSERNKDHARALLGFWALDERGAPAIPELTRMLDDASAADRAIGALGLIQSPAIPALQAALTHTNVIVRRGALIGLAEMKPATPAALSASIQLVSDAHAKIRAVAVSVMNRYTNEMDLTWPFVQQALADPDIKVRRSALRSLKHFGHRAEPVLAILREQLRTTDSLPYFSAIASGLRELSASKLPVADCLMEGFRSSHERHRIITARTLALFGRSASNVLPGMKLLHSQAAEGTYRDELAKAVSAVADGLGMDSGVETNRVSRRQADRGRDSSK